ncbi:MAG: efflux RND transporter periplasmic adaptor subunit [Holophagales bacterium]|nr:MAG: efflux RND transporter periplasmic adaptor subunit [Holophagales bacterium]
MTRLVRTAASTCLAILGLSLGACDRAAVPNAETTVKESPSGDAKRIIHLAPEALVSAGITLGAAELRPLHTQIETTGSVDFDQRLFAHVSPRVGGRVEAALAEAGDFVRSGQVLARVDSIALGEAIGEYLQARARAELARETFERERGLFADRVSSQQEMLSAQAAAREADAALRGAEEHLHLLGLSDDQVQALGYDQPRASIYEVRAPFAGTIVERHATLGEMVEPQAPLFQIADLSRVWVWIDVFERDLARVHLGDDVELHVEAFPGVAFEGKLVYLGSRVETESRTARARIEVPNPDGRLRPGMFARVRISDPHAADGKAESVSVLAVPESALQREGDDFVAFVALGDGRFESRKVRTGRKGDGFVEILDGLSAGESVAVSGTFVLKSEASKESLGGEE